MIINRTVDDYRALTQSIPSLLKLSLSYHAAFIGIKFLGFAGRILHHSLATDGETTAS
jgi:hypothetical protein